MKTQLSAYELGYLVKELQQLVGGKIARVYQPQKKKLSLQIHIPSKGKQILNIFLPGFLYLSEGKMVNPDKPFGFCTFLRKHIENNRIESIEQDGFERIVKIVLQSKEKKRILVIELFGKGNILLCEEDYKIISVLENQKMKERSLLGGLPYKKPQSGVNIDDLQEVTDALNNSTKENVELMIAVDLGLGGLLAKELCLMCKFEPTVKIPKFGVMRLFEALKEIRERKSNPRIIYEDKIIDVVPVEFLTYKNSNQHTAKSFSEGLSKLVGLSLENEVSSEKEKTYSGEMKKVQNLLDKQKKQLKAIEDGVDLNTKKADKLYEQYQVVSEALHDVKTVVDQKMDWDEIKERFKDHKVVKEVDAKEKKVYVEL